MTETLKRIKARCTMDGSCWIWPMAKDGRSPEINVRGRIVKVRRYLLALNGVDLRGKRASVCCGSKACVNPDHLVAIEQSEIVKRGMAEMDLAKVLTRNRRLAISAQRRRGKFTLDQVRAIREDSRDNEDVAADYGVSEMTIRYVREHKRYKTYDGFIAQLIGVKQT
jgi:hypothetical protein